MKCIICDLDYDEAKSVTIYGKLPNHFNCCSSSCYEKLKARSLKSLTNQDTCGNCSVRGDWQACRNTPCVTHNSWYVTELERWVR
jgi:hypothetical protein